MTARRGFLLGKFMPPHAGHVALIEAARALVDELTVLVCWLPDDEIPGPTRLGWMQGLFPDCRVVGHGEVVPQAPEDSPDFWAVWRGIVQAVHPDPIDLVFAGESYGSRLADEVGGRFIPLGNRVLGAPHDPLGEISGSAVRSDPGAHWPLLPEPVRDFYRRTVCLHGGESTGKSTLAARLAEALGTVWVGEYGRSHCETYRDPLTLADLELIAKAQQAMIAAARPWSGPRLIADTDALMTAAWTEMLLDERPRAMLEFPKADLYLLLEPDLPWVDDGTRFFASAQERDRFNRMVERVLVDTGVPFARVGGSGDLRFTRALAAIEAMA